MSASDDNLAELRDALRADAAGVAEALLGAPNRAHSTKKTLRWGNKGSLALRIEGKDQGLWVSHETNKGGDLLSLIQHIQGCDFVAAVAWARHWTGIPAKNTANDTPSTAQRRAQQEDDCRARQAAQEAIQAAKTAAEEGRRINVARRIAAVTTPVAGTLADRYLRQVRGIVPEPQSWPDAIRFHPGRCALVGIATTSSGAVQAVQRVHLAKDGRKIDQAEVERRRLWAIKVTNGVLDGAAVRLPGPADGPLLLCEGPETAVALWATTQHETWCALGKSNIPKVDVPLGRRVVVCAEYSDQPGYLDDTIASWRSADIDAIVAWPWITRPDTGTDFNDLLLQDGVEAVQQAIQAACAAPASPTPAPHYLRPRLGFNAATKRLRWTVAAWFNRVELHLVAQDWIAAETERLIPELAPQSEARILASLRRRNPKMDLAEAEALAADRGQVAARRMARQRARRAAAARFGQRAVSGDMPRIQIRGAAGLGKTAAIIAEYVKRPGLWDRHIHVFVRNLQLAADFAADMAAAMENAPRRIDGIRPRVMVIQGRGQGGMCHPERQPLADAAAKYVDSVYNAVCKTPACDGKAEILCPFHAGCEESGYLAQFADKAPALRLFAHHRLSLLQPQDLRLPHADLVIVDESAISALVQSVTVDPADLTAHGTYTAAVGQEHLIQEAMDVGRAIIAALSGTVPALDALRQADVQVDQLRSTAKAATDAAEAAEAAKPQINAGMSYEAVAKQLENHTSHRGKAVAAVMAQLARDMENGRAASNGIEWDALATATTKDGGRVSHPVILRHSLATAVGAPSDTALLVLDADADLEINRRLFGPDLRSFQIDAVRQTYGTQVSDASLATSSIAPDHRLPNNQAKAAQLRERVVKLVQRETAGGRKVLVLTTLPVRRALTGEKDARVTVSVSWHDAELTHYGRHLGANQWSAFDTVILLGREQLPPLATERLARAIYADAPTVTITPTGEYDHEPRHHDLRHGTANPAMVQAHADPRVQAIVEMGRECGMGQGIDRLRPVRRNPAKPVRVIVACNLPVPGLVVDRLMTLDHLLEGGTPVERALGAMPGGILPLSPDWLCQNMRGLFPSRRTAVGAAAEVKCSLAIYSSYCQVALYSVAGQFRPSKALVRIDVAAPQAALERLLGKPVVSFRMEAPPPEPIASSRDPPKPDLSPADHPPAQPMPASPVLTCGVLSLPPRVPAYAGAVVPVVVRETRAGGPSAGAGPP